MFFSPRLTEEGGEQQNQRLALNDTKHRGF
jgi:hypothetical protein